MNVLQSFNQSSVLLTLSFQYGYILFGLAKFYIVFCHLCGHSRDKITDENRYQALRETQP